MRPLMLTMARRSESGDGSSSDAVPGDDGGVAKDTPQIDASNIDARPAADAAVATCTPQSGTNLALQPVATGLSSPVFLTAPPGDARLFIVEQPGRIRIVKDGTLLETPFLDIRGPVRSTGDEEGLLGLAFHPDYAQNGRFFVYYTADSPNGDNLVAEYTVGANPDVADTAEERLITFAHPGEGNHNGGGIAFGPDGYLYIGTGDGGGSNDEHGNGQPLTTPLGKMLRIDVDVAGTYAIPATNPFVGDGGGVREEIWANGLRNPWRWSFDRMTDDLYIADVGQLQREEVNVQPAASTGGENYGWSR